jgi:toxin ParE1/3/4
MAELIWTEPALHDLDAIADYIALDNPKRLANWCGRFSGMSSNFKDIPRAVRFQKNFAG